MRPTQILTKPFNESVTGPGAISRVPQMTQAMADLQQSMESVGTALDELERRLAPVLSRGSPEPDKPQDNQVGNAPPLVCEISNNAGFAKVFVDQINNILSRLEI